MKKELKYIPSRGDIVWLNFEPQTGKGQSGRRPALVLSPLAYNKKVGLAVFCPITSQIKGYPFEVQIEGTLPIHGVILCDQIKNIDWQQRNCEWICRIKDDVIKTVLAKVKTLIQ